jgi:predicted amidophosphoribosyltransferase
MNAKAAQRINFVQPGSYVCQKCQAQFQYESGPLSCPRCKTQKADDLVSFYSENDPERDEMLSKDEFGAGD